MQPTEPTILAICFDFGDTLCDEATEVKDETNTTLRAELIPGAAETVLELKRRGYRLTHATLPGQKCARCSGSLDAAVVLRAESAA